MKQESSGFRRGECQESTGTSIGLDLGLKAFCVTSEGLSYDNQKHLTKSEKKLVRLQRQLSRKAKGSANQEKARIQVARLPEHIANQRCDAMHKLSSQLVRDYDVICLENLQIKNMVKNHRLARSISDVAWGEFTRQLTYKCRWHHRVMIQVDKFFPSSQLCSSCGFQNPVVKDLAIRKWACPSCGAIHDCDVNAAQNILIEGQRLLAG